MANEEATFRRRALDLIANDGEAVRLRLDKTEQTASRLADAVEQQAVNISNLSANVNRLERAVTQLVAENAAQRETVNSLIKLATKLVEQRAS